MFIFLYLILLNMKINLNLFYINLLFFKNNYFIDLFFIYKHILDFILDFFKLYNSI